MYLFICLFEQSNCLIFFSLLKSAFPFCVYYFKIFANQELDNIQIFKMCKQLWYMYLWQISFLLMLPGRNTKVFNLHFRRKKIAFDLFFCLRLIHFFFSNFWMQHEKKIVIFTSLIYLVFNEIYFMYSVLTKYTSWCRHGIFTWWYVLKQFNFKTNKFWPQKIVFIHMNLLVSCKLRKKQEKWSYISFFILRDIKLNFLSM